MTPKGVSIIIDLAKNQMSGTLYIVATPIGNLKDVTLRAISILSDIDIIYAEDTRVTRKLLSSLSTNYQLPAPKLLSYHQHSSENTKYEILNSLLYGKSIALVTDAGTPGISDPGNELIDFLLDKEPNIKVIPIPGPSALTAALSVSGFDVSHFNFIGFFPKKKRTKVFEAIGESKVAYVFFESPQRLLKTLGELRDYVSEDRRLFVGRELTKMYEETFRGKLDEVLEGIQKSDLRGEVIVIVEKSGKVRS